MMTVADAGLYRCHRAVREHEGIFSIHGTWLPMLLFGSMGAITWAIRGSNGWGGIDGTIVPGLTWGLLWYYLCRRKGIDARSIVLWLGMGIAIGGELGYGQYASCSGAISVTAMKSCPSLLGPVVPGSLSAASGGARPAVFSWDGR